MTTKDKTVLVFGATGQQGGAAARALSNEGFRVRALVRDTSSPKAKELRDLGIELVTGDFRDRASIDRATHGAYGVFSIQPSSGQPQYGVTDEDELAFGTAIVEAAEAAGVAHLVYTSMAGLLPGTGIGHFESKWQIEQRLRAGKVPFTIVRPSAFMELLLEPHFGLARRELVFFLRPEHAMQFIAKDDIGTLVARVFADPGKHVGKTIELAGDQLTGRELAAKIGDATGASISYSRFAPEVLAQSELLRRLVEVVDAGGAVGNADLAEIKTLHPGILDLDAWLARGGAERIRAQFAPLA